MRWVSLLMNRGAAKGESLQPQSGPQRSGITHPTATLQLLGAPWISHALRSTLGERELTMEQPSGNGGRRIEGKQAEQP